MSSRLRSFLFVPGDSERKQTKALATTADALILDLEDSVDVTQLPAARTRVRELLRSRPDRSRQQLWVRVNALSSGRLLDDLAAVMGDAGRTAAGALRGAVDGGVPDGIVLPKVSAPREVEEVAHYLAALEASGGRAVGATRLVVIATETPRGLLSLPQYPDSVMASPAVAQRLGGLTWGSEDLGAALGVMARTDASGVPTSVFQLARTSCLLTAVALGVQAIDGVHVDFRDGAGLAREIDNARRDGFTAKLAIHPDQIDAINAAFTPTAVEIAKARRIVALFAASPGAGVLSLDGQMIDRPHFIQAQRILEGIDSKEIPS
ncbi:MAG: CoA ester lyase [Gammaproteobacteria bacterium]|jgi:citrate lyase subunit beta/citryl-CoA lyase|nr:CoA ester lyase [Gammaproteobacteria bacterium]